MKALSLKQPFAWAVVHGGKTIENRVWSTRFRGDFLVHASKNDSSSYYEWASEWIRSAWRDLGVTGLKVPPREELERGGIVGVATLVDVLPRSGGLVYPAHRWRMPEQYGFVLENVRPLPFLAYKGLQGFFEMHGLTWTSRTTL